MAEQTDGAAAQGAETSAAQGASTEQQGDAQGATQQKQDDAVALRSHIETLESENARFREERRKREDAEKKQQKAAKTEGSEVEKLQTRLTEMESALSERDKRAQEQSLRLASVTTAQRLGFRNPDIAYRLLDPAKVEFDEDGSAKNVDALLQDIAKSDPYLLASTDFGGGQRGASAASGKQDMNTLIRKAAGRP